MANRAVSRESGLGVIRVGRLLIILQVARSAILRDVRVVVVDVTAGAGRVDMSAGQREAGKRRVIKLRLQPRIHVVARGARGRKRKLHVIRIFCRGVVLDVAANAVCRRALVLPSHVTLRAFQIGVCAYQGEPGKAQVIELGPEPRIHVAVAHLTLRRKTESDVTGPGGLLELLQVAADAVGG